MKIEHIKVHEMQVKQGLDGNLQLSVCAKKEENLNDRRTHLKKLEKVKASSTKEVKNQNQGWWKHRKINQSKNHLFEKINKTTKPLARQTEKKKKNRNYQNQLLLKRNHCYPPYRNQRGIKAIPWTTLHQQTTQLRRHAANSQKDTNQQNRFKNRKPGSIHDHLPKNEWLI